MLAPESLYNSIAEINLDKLKNNVAILRGYMKPGVRQMAVIKANAYGHGAVKIASFLDDKVEWFGVCSLPEAIELREHGIKKDILILGAPEPETAHLYSEYQLTAVISSFEHFNWLPEKTVCHLKFDTGMGRFGFFPEQVKEVLQQMKIHSNLYYQGLMTHFAKADDPGSPMVEKQLQRFGTIQKHFDSTYLTHAANTGALAFYDGTQFDMVRTGIGLYGYPPGNTVIEGLKPVMKWRSRLVSCKYVQKGATVSYHAKWTARENGYVGVIPVGYADGVRRNLTGNYQVQIEENNFPVVGIITMDYIMVSLGEQSFPVGTPVAVMGNEGNTAKDWGDRMDTISYEILCGISASRVKRMYLNG